MFSSLNRNGLNVQRNLTRALIITFRRYLTSADRPVIRHQEYGRKRDVRKTGVKKCRFKNKKTGQVRVKLAWRWT